MVKSRIMAVIKIWLKRTKFFETSFILLNRVTNEKIAMPVNLKNQSMFVFFMLSLILSSAIDTRISNGCNHWWSNEQKQWLLTKGSRRSRRGKKERTGPSKGQIDSKRESGDRIRKNSLNILCKKLKLNLISLIKGETRCFSHLYAGLYF